MTFFRQSLGKKGERLAMNYLRQAGYKIISSNYRTRLGEIDLIAEEGETLVFVEVKTRSSKNCGHPLESITPSKKRQIEKVALEYLSKNRQFERNIRFDAVAVFFLPPGNAPEIELVRDIF